MKTSELSIKDWVIDSTGEYVIVDGIGCSDYNEIRRNMNLPIRTDDEDDRYLGIINPAQKRTYNEHMEEIKPIPLTEEILKANEIMFYDSDKEYRLRKRTDIDNYWEIIAFRTSRGDLFFEIQNVHPHRSESVRRAIIYVHELQHALRICGLSELADNFVIEKGGEG